MNKYFYWGLVGLQGFQLLGFLTERYPSLQITSIPILCCTLLIIALGAYIDYSKYKNNGVEPNFWFLLAPHISIAILVLTSTLLGGYLGNQ